MVYQPLLYLQVLIAGDLFSNISFRFSDFMKAAICVLSMPSQWIVQDFEVFQAMSLHTLSEEISLKSWIQFPPTHFNRVHSDTAEYRKWKKKKKIYI